MGIVVRRGTRRFVTQEPGQTTRHSFSFGPHYDPDDLGFGPLVCHDDHVLGPGAGFPEHPHSGLEIVTWVVAGGLVHDQTSLLRPGQVAVQSAGTGIVHSEVAGGEPTRFVQAWLRPDDPTGEPARSVADVVLEPGVLTPVAGPAAPVPVGVAGAALAVVRLEPRQRVTLAPAALTHGYVVAGSVAVPEGLPDGPPDGVLGEGDALRIDRDGCELVAHTPAEVLVWSFS